MKKFIVLLVGLLLFAGASDANLVQNPGFETDVEPDGNADYWSTYTSSTWTPHTYDSRNTANPRSGDYACYLDATGVLTQPSWIMAFQKEPTIAVTAGTTYDFSIWYADAMVGGEAALANSGKVQLIWKNASGGNADPASNVTAFLNVGNSSYQELALSAVAPATATALRVSLFTDMNAAANIEELDGKISGFYFDDVSVTPEPATLALIGFGGLFLRKRKLA